MFEGYAEDAALAWDGIFEEDASIVVFLNDAPSEGETEAPATLFGGESAFEDVFLLRGGNAFAGVAEVDVDVVAFGGEDCGEGAVAFHSIDGVLADVFDNPFEEVSVDGCYDRSVG